MNILSLDTLQSQAMRLLGGLLGALTLVTVGCAFAVGGEKWIAAPVVIALSLYPLWAALTNANSASARAAMALALSAVPAALLFVFEGYAWQIDLHMMFFASLAAIAILYDLRAILAATGFVAVHHLGLGLLAPEWVFLNGGSIGRILLHAVILVVEAATLIWMAVRTQGLVSKVNDESSERQAADAARLAEREAEAKTWRSVRTHLEGSLEALKNGDFSRDIDADFPGDYAPLKQNFNEALGALRRLIGSVTESTAAIRGGASEIMQASEDLARRTEANAASLEETSASLTEVDARVKANARAAGETASRAGQAMEAVARGRSVAGRAAATMQRVSDSARDIDAVIEGLDKIAFQTRVLAMNAAVEAGRAGEAGRGFAVVADLVSALAMRAEEESKSAREQLTLTQTGINDAAEAVQLVDGALETISAGVTEVNDLLGTMAKDNEAQSSALTQVSAAVGEMDKATQQNAAMVEEASAAARNLSSEVASLAQQAGRFKVGAAGTTTRRPANKVHELVGRAQQAAAAPRPVKQVANGGTVTADDDWNEF